jgi:hypothetical protein
MGRTLQPLTSNSGSNTQSVIKTTSITKTIKMTSITDVDASAIAIPRINRIPQPGFPSHRLKFDQRLSRDHRPTLQASRRSFSEQKSSVRAAAYVLILNSNCSFGHSASTFAERRVLRVESELGWQDYTRRFRHLDSGNRQNGSESDFREILRVVRWMLEHARSEGVFGIVNRAETRIVVEDGQCRARTYDLSGVNRMLFQLS